MEYKKRKWTTQDMDELVKRFNDGQRFEDIAQDMNRTIEGTKTKIKRLRKEKTHNIYSRHNPKDSTVYLIDINNPLHTFGLGLYAGDGTKRGNSVEFVNMDSTIVKGFLNFLYSIDGFDMRRLKAKITLFDSDDEYKCKEYWVKATRIPRDQFTKTIYKKVQGGTGRKREGYHGVITLRYYSSPLLQIIRNKISDICNEKVREVK